MELHFIYFSLFCFLPPKQIKVCFLLQKKPQAVMACVSAGIYSTQVNKKEVMRFLS